MSFASLLLPERHRLAGDIAPVAVRRALARADHVHQEPGERAQLQRHFSVDPAVWPVAALTRRIDVPKDLDSAVWLRADPAWIQPDLVGARLMAYGPGVQPGHADVAALAPALHGLFHHAGIAFDAPVPTRWYLRLPVAQDIPTFDQPESVLGKDILQYLPAGESGVRWRQLFTQAQMILHQHPWNERRQAEGLPPINALWFWGEGRRPQSVNTHYLQVRSRDALLQGLAQAAGLDHPNPQLDKVDALVDLRHLRSMHQVAQEALLPLVTALRQRQLNQLVVDFQDGYVVCLRHQQRWRLWRRWSRPLG